MLRNGSIFGSTQHRFPSSQSRSLRNDSLLSTHRQLHNPTQTTRSTQLASQFFLLSASSAIFSFDTFIDFTHKFLVRPAQLSHILVSSILSLSLFTFPRSPLLSLPSSLLSPSLHYCVPSLLPYSFQLCVSSH